MDKARDCGSRYWQATWTWGYEGILASRMRSHSVRVKVGVSGRVVLRNVRNGICLGVAEVMMERSDDEIAPRARAEALADPREVVCVFARAQGGNRLGRRVRTLQCQTECDGQPGWRR